MGTILPSVDRKRINGPERSIPPLRIEDPDDPPHFNVTTGIRADGRTLEALRPTFMHTGVLPTADGSSFFEASSLKLICSVYGPRPDRRSGNTDRGRITVDYRHATFASPERSSFIRCASDKDYSAIIATALLPAVLLESFPKSIIDIFILVLENDGNSACLAAAVTAASLALVDAGVEMIDMVTGSSASVVDGNIVMDLTLAEEKDVEGSGSLFLAFMPNLNQVTQVIQTGEMSIESSEEVMEMCIDVCAEVHVAARKCLISGLLDANETIES